MMSIEIHSKGRVALTSSGRRKTRLPVLLSMQFSHSVPLGVRFPSLICGPLTAFQRWAVLSGPAWSRCDELRGKWPRGQAWALRWPRKSSSSHAGRLFDARPMSLVEADDTVSVYIFEKSSVLLNFDLVDHVSVWAEVETQGSTAR